MKDLHVVVGGHGGTGRAVVAALAACGARVKAVSRSGEGPPPPRSRVRAGRAADAVSMREACRDAGVVYHCVNVPYMRWLSGLFPIAKTVAGALGQIIDESRRRGQGS